VTTDSFKALALALQCVNSTRSRHVDANLVGKGIALVWNVLASQVQTSKPRVADGIRIYAVGDVHGRADLLEAVLARIDADLAAYPIEQSVQVFLGDYIDRGPYSREVLDHLIIRRRQHQMVYLTGNHENY
jgi:serine/threonine protein phosphatase 1